MDLPATPDRTLEELKREHGVHLGGRLSAPRGELNEQSPVRNYVRDLVLGFNDGIVSVFAVTAGVAGAAFGQEEILITGAAAAIAGAFSMAAGEFISTKSQAQFYAAERAREAEHLQKWPHLEIEELRESLESKGIKPPLLEEVVQAISSDRSRFLDYMMKEEFGIGEESDRSPVRASIIVMLAFLLGSLFAVIPYGLASGRTAIIASSVASLGALFLAGVVRARASRLPAVAAGIEMVFVGLLAGVLTYGVGRLLGVAI